MSHTMSEVFEAYSQAWAQHDPDAIVALHTDDTVFQSHGFAEPAVGRAAVREAAAGLFAMAPDLAFEARRTHFGEDHYVIEYEMTGTVAGRACACEGVDVFAIRDGLVARKDTYVDTHGLFQQIGMA